MALGHVDDERRGLVEELRAARVRREQRAVARQRQADGLVQAVHAVRGEHARARAAGRARGPLHLGELVVADSRVARGDHRVDEVELSDEGLAVAIDRPRDLARLHGAAGDEHRRDVQAHRREEHAGRDLVAVRDAEEGVGAVRVHHVLDAVGDEIAARQRIQHPAVAHGDAVVDRNGVELDAPATGRVDGLLHLLPDVVQVHVAGDELGEAIGDGDDRLLEVGVVHARRPPERSRARHVAPRGRGAASISRSSHVPQTLWHKRRHRQGGRTSTGACGPPYPTPRAFPGGGSSGGASPLPPGRSGHGCGGCGAERAKRVEAERPHRTTRVSGT